MNYASYILVVLLVADFLLNLYWDVNGRAERKPLGFLGIIKTLIVYILMVFLYWKAGVITSSP